ncbi:MAG: hypothetical protein P8Y06_02275, partial [Patescibacteria group bacterium]
RAPRRRGGRDLQQPDLRPGPDPAAPLPAGGALPGVETQAFEEEIPWVKSKDIILGREEGMFGGDFKALSVDEFNVGLHIEDAIEEAMAVAEKTDAYVLVVPQPWNIGEEGRKINHPRIKHLGDYFGLAGTWPVLRFLVSKEAAEFFPKA